MTKVTNEWGQEFEVPDRPGFKFEPLLGGIAGLWTDQDEVIYLAGSTEFVGTYRWNGGPR